MNPRSRPAVGSGRAAAIFLPKAEAPWLRFFHDLAAGGECHAGIMSPDETLLAVAEPVADLPGNASHEATDDAAEALTSCAKLAIQLEQIVREIAAASRVAGLDFEIVGNAVFKQVFNRTVVAIKEEQQSKKEVGEKATAECLDNSADDETTVPENQSRKSSHDSNSSSSSSSDVKNNEEAEEGKDEACCVCEPLDDKVTLLPVSIRLMSGETVALPDIESGTQVREVHRRLQAIRPLNRDTAYSLLDGERILTAEEIVVGKCYTAVVRKDRRLLQYPYQVGDLKVGDIIRTRWRENSKAFHARILGFTEEQPPRIRVQWQYTSGNDWAWQTAPIHFEWVLEIRRSAPNPEET
mmetsp:Transcript_102039/g.197559  ORF Transcript_102039/g.197559 Transcript_102039/m.197559 type:complete len:353 (+) Transcript_102039:69-1127(+)